MSTGLALALVILVVLAASLAFLINAEGGLSQVPRLLERAGIPSEFVDRYFEPEVNSAPFPGSSVPAEFQSGISRFSQGACQAASDCVTAGCSGEVCGTDPDVVTTCELRADFPTEQGLSCTCLPQGVCGWQ